MYHLKCISKLHSRLSTDSQLTLNCKSVVTNLSSNSPWSIFEQAYHSQNFPGSCKGCPQNTSDLFEGNQLCVGYPDKNFLGVTKPFFAGPENLHVVCFFLLVTTAKAVPHFPSLVSPPLVYRTSSPTCPRPSR